MLLDQYGRSLHGKARSQRAVGLLFALGALCLAGLPPFGAGLGKALGEEAAGHVLLPVFLMTSAVTGAALLRAAARILRGAPEYGARGRRASGEGEEPEPSAAPEGTAPAHGRGSGRPAPVGAARRRGSGGRGESRPRPRSRWSGSLRGRGSAWARRPWPAAAPPASGLGGGPRLAVGVAALLAAVALQA
ncbi:hypothetical protein [Streptomyces sp. NPDC001903]|uniref:hypothetical protein n=1 Tax=Streptomyces sp. NPDC001903 TaxID=3364622 RepID=UPI00369996C4